MENKNFLLSFFVNLYEGSFLEVCAKVLDKKIIKFLFEYSLLIKFLKILFLIIEHHYKYI